MKNKLILIGLLVASVMLGTACSGLIPNFRPKGEVVSATYIAQFSGSGSLSTLWYHGSDTDYHYFAHYAKISTRYRVRRVEITIPDEFPYTDRRSVFIGMSPVWRAIKNQEPQTRNEPNQALQTMTMTDF